MTTIPNAIMITWFSPSRIVRRAIGNCTLTQLLPRVQPNDIATSLATTGTLRRPRFVSRTAGGTAYTTVAITAGGFWMPNITTSGIR